MNKNRKADHLLSFKILIVALLILSIKPMWIQAAETNGTASKTGSLSREQVDSSAESGATQEAEASFESLQWGDAGENVKKIQIQLNALGYLTATPDGDFGPITEQAVVAFQNASGLEATGIVDQKTYRSLFGENEAAAITQNAAPASDNSMIAMYATVHLNVRSGPGSDTELLGVIPQGTEVQAGASENGWTQIDYQGGTGYVSSKRLSTEAPDVVPVVAPTPSPTPVPVEIESEEVKGTSSDDYERWVWIPTDGGKRYHAYEDCSGMLNPIQVTESEAKARGFTPCARCKWYR